MKAERETADRLIAHFLADRIGATFQGRISGVTRAGLFVKLDDTGADGLIPIRTLGGEYYQYDEARHALIGTRSGAMHRLGDTVDVRLVEAAPVAGALRFELLSEGTVEPRGRKRDGKRDDTATRSAMQRRRPTAARAKNRKPRKPKPGSRRRASHGNGEPQRRRLDPPNRRRRKRDLKPAMWRGFRGRCPNCGEGKLFRAFLKTNDHCSVCGQDFTTHRADDLPAYLVIVIVGHIVVPLALSVETNFAPPVSCILRYISPSPWSCRCAAPTGQRRHGRLAMGVPDARI